MKENRKQLRFLVARSKILLSIFELSTLPTILLFSTIAMIIVKRHTAPCIKMAGEECVDKRSNTFDNFEGPR